MDGRAKLSWLREFTARAREGGVATAHAAIPGLYAWGITVAPVAWARGSSVAVKGAAISALAALVVAPLLERSRCAAERRTGVAPAGGVLAFARLVALWGFVGPSALVWTLARPEPSVFQGARGVLGVFAWGLFALATAGPALPGGRRRASEAPQSRLRPRIPLPSGDQLYVAAGAGLATVLQAIGWEVAAAERAVLVRVVTTTCSLAVLSATTQLAAARHLPRGPHAGRSQMQRAFPWLIVAALLIGGGLAVALTR